MAGVAQWIESQPMDYEVAGTVAGSAADRAHALVAGQVHG